MFIRLHFQFEWNNNNKLFNEKNKKTKKKHDEHVLSAALVSVTESDHGRREEFAAKRGSFVVLFFYFFHLPVHTARVTLTTEIVHTSQSLAASIPPPYPRIFYFQKNKQNTTGRAAHAKPPDSSSSQPKSHEQGRTHTHTSFLLFYILC